MRVGRNKVRSILLNHYFRGLHDGTDRVANLELQLVGTTPCDGALDEIVTHAHHDMGHDVAQLDFLDFSAQLVSS